MARIIGVALNSAKKFLGFVDEKGKIRKGRVRGVRKRNPKMTKSERSKAIQRFAKKHGFYARTVRYNTDLRMRAIEEWNKNKSH